MTQLQIDEVLDSVGVLTNEWVTLQGIFNYIILDSDRTLFCDTISAQFYFPAGEEFFLIRNSSGKPKPDGYVLKSNQYEYNYKGIPYVVSVYGGGKVYSEEVGIYHDIISIGSIAAFMKK
jgi:hypothetical protein